MTDAETAMNPPAVTMTADGTEWCVRVLRYDGPEGRAYFRCWFPTEAEARAYAEQATAGLDGISSAVELIDKPHYRADT